MSKYKVGDTVVCNYSGIKYQVLSVEDNKDAPHYEVLSLGKPEYKTFLHEYQVSSGAEPDSTEAPNVKPEEAGMRKDKNDRWERAEQLNEDLGKMLALAAMIMHKMEKLTKIADSLTVEGIVAMSDSELQTIEVMLKEVIKELEKSIF
jgi:hypothetical protein